MTNTNGNNDQQRAPVAGNIDRPIARRDHETVTRDDAYERAHQLLVGERAAGLRAIEENVDLHAEIVRLKSMLAISDDRGTQLANMHKITAAERDFLLRFAAAVNVRSDVIDMVAQAAHLITETGKDLDAITNLARNNADAAHQAAQLLASLRTTIDNAKLEANEIAKAGYRQQITNGSAQVDEQPDQRTAEIAKKFAAGS